MNGNFEAKCEDENKVVTMEEAKKETASAPEEKKPASLLGKQVIVVAETLIMYAEVSREEKQEDGSTFIGVHAIKFTDDVLQYLFSHIG